MVYFLTSLNRGGRTGRRDADRTNQYAEKKNSFFFCFHSLNLAQGKKEQQPAECHVPRDNSGRFKKRKRTWPSFRFPMAAGGLIKESKVENHVASVSLRSVVCWDWLGPVNVSLETVSVITYLASRERHTQPSPPPPPPVMKSPNVFLWSCPLHPGKSRNFGPFRS